MKIIKSSLFEKLKDNEIILNTNIIIGGDNAPESSSRTGDNECTLGGIDCTDNTTQIIYDGSPTDPNNDACDPRPYSPIQP